MANMKTKSASRAQNTKEDTTAGTPSATMHVGEVLRQSREERDITLDMVADELMIRRFYLDALENGTFTDLPERVYAMGFVKNYANYLGLDAKAMMDQFKRDAYGARQGAHYQVELNMPEPVVHSVVPGRSAMLTAVVFLVLLIAGVIWLTQKDKTTVDTIPEPAPNQASIAVPELTDVPATAPVANAAEAPAFASAATAQNSTTQEPEGFVSATPAADAAVTATQETPAATDAASATDAKETSNDATAEAADETPAAVVPSTVKNHRVLEAVQSSWVEVRDEKNTILFTSILKAGQILPLPDNTRLTLTTGNAGGLRLIIDGKPQSVFGQANEVKRNIVIAPKPLDRQ